MAEEDEHGQHDGGFVKRRNGGIVEPAQAGRR
jgi:hypothetical protein